MILKHDFDDDTMHKIYVYNVLPDRMKAFIKANRTESSNISLKGKANATILDDIITKLRSYPKPYYEDFIRKDLPDDFSKLPWIDQVNDSISMIDDFDELETLACIHRLFDKIGIHIHILEAYEIWASVSEAYSAGWLMKPDGDYDVWWGILTNWLY